MVDDPFYDVEFTSGPGIDEPPVGTPGWDEGCGISYDHTLRLIGEKDGIQTFECEECGAEVVEDPNAEAPF